MRAGADRPVWRILLGLSAVIGLSLAGPAACIPDVVPDVLALPRCDQVAARCGPAGDEGCCADPVVPGGTFNRVNDPQLPAAIEGFRLDRFEVTVGRFRQFVAEYPANKPAAGAGAHPLIDASGWDPAWNAMLPGGQADLRASLGCDEIFQTWTGAPGANEALPVNCVSWYVAFAFCAWDEGRLPTEAEWNFAAAGGNEQRLYPWGAAAPDPTLAEYGCNTETTGCLIPRVGSKSPAGDGAFGQADLAGSMSEWVLDFHGTQKTPCNNCATLEDETFGREARGGDFAHLEELIATTYRIGYAPDTRETHLGIRCARDR